MYALKHRSGYQPEDKCQCRTFCKLHTKAARLSLSLFSSLLFLLAGRILTVRRIPGSLALVELLLITAVLVGSSVLTVCAAILVSSVCAVCSVVLRCAVLIRSVII